MIITAGKNVHPEEIERVLESHPAVIAAGVLGVSDERRGERLVALLRFGPDARPPSSDLIGHARLSRRSIKSRAVLRCRRTGR